MGRGKKHKLEESVPATDLTNLKITSKLDAGRIEVVDASRADNIQLKLIPEPFTEYDHRAHMMWFHFRVAGVKDVPLTMKILNAAEASFPEAWPGYCGCGSSDLKYWFRMKTEYKDGVLTFHITPEQDSIYIAYFAPYPLQRHFELIARMQCLPRVRQEVLGQSLDGYDIDLLVIGEPGPDKRIVWLVSRQHPGETMAEWFTEGFLERLTDPHDGPAIKTLKQAIFYVVPNMNPDGSTRGHQRTNAKGANLNREWAKPTLDYSPEVYWTLKRMEQTGCDLFIDVHGDEEIAYNFLAGEEGIPAYDERLKQLQQSFEKEFLAASPDFQVGHGYEVDKPGDAEMSIACNAVGQKFDCLSFTLEMPYKDDAEYPDELTGWSPERCKRFGASVVVPIFRVLPKLRDA